MIRSRLLESASVCSMLTVESVGYVAERSWQANTGSATTELRYATEDETWSQTSRQPVATVVMEKPLWIWKKSLA